MLLLVGGGSPQVCLGSTLPYFFPVNETAAGIKYSTAEAALSKAMVYYSIERSSPRDLWPHHRVSWLHVVGPPRLCLTQVTYLTNFVTMLNPGSGT